MYYSQSALRRMRQLSPISSVLSTRRPQVIGLHSAIPRPNSVSMESIRELRKRTGAPIGAVKKALVEQSGDLEAAIDHLRKLGASMVAKKAHKEASEGLIGIAISPDKTRASLVEVNSETDFVARTPQFGQVVRAISLSVLSNSMSSDTALLEALNTEDLLHLDGNKDILANAVSSLDENIVLRRASYMQVDMEQSSIFGYVHGACGEGGGRIGALVGLEGSDLEEMGQRLAMHIAAAAPTYVTVDSIPRLDEEKERAILLDAAEAEKKPINRPTHAVLKKMVDGRLRKWYSAVVLEEQEMLVESATYNGKPRSVAKHIASESSGAKILQMCRFCVGEK